MADPRMHPITLRFSGELEPRYARHRLDMDRQATIKLCVASMVLFILGFGIVWIITPELRWQSRAAHVALAALLGFTALLNDKVRNPAIINPLGIPIAIAVVLLMLYAHAQTYSPGIFALYTLVAMVMAALPQTFVYKALEIGVVAVAISISTYMAVQHGGHIHSLSVCAYVACVVGITISHALDTARRESFLRGIALDEERNWSRSLLESIIPARLANALRSVAEGSAPIVEEHADVTIVFADLVGFTPLAATLPAQELVGMLNTLFSRFDAAVMVAHADKIKTIGDSYMVACGLEKQDGHHAARQAALLALEFRETVVRYNALTGSKLQLRIGMHCGPVVAGVIGRSRFHFDLWGETVNYASRMESHGRPGEISVSEALSLRLRDEFALASRGSIEVKGVGFRNLYVLDRPVAVDRAA